MKNPKMRRAVSFAAITYVRMWLHCHREGVAMAAWLDGLANAELDLRDAPTPTRAEAHAAIHSIREAKATKGQRAKLSRVVAGIARAKLDPLVDAAQLCEFHSGNGHFL
jgi:hypothetical protein